MFLSGGVDAGFVALRTFRMTSVWLAVWQNALMLDQDFAEEEDTAPGWLTIEDTTTLFTQAVNETSIFVTYQSFNNRTIRQSMRISDDIWQALEPAIKDEMNAIRITATAVHETTTTAATGNNMIMSVPTEGHQPVEDGGIPIEANNVENVTDHATDTVTSLHINSSLFAANDNNETDDGTLLLRVYSVDTRSSDPEAPTGKALVSTATLPVTTSDRSADAQPTLPHPAVSVLSTPTVSDPVSQHNLTPARLVIRHPYEFPAPGETKPSFLDYAIPDPRETTPAFFDPQLVHTFFETRRSYTLHKGGLPVDKDYKGANRGVAKHNLVCLTIPLLPPHYTIHLRDTNDILPSKGVHW